MRTFVDLFCGIGGFHYAASDLGLQCVLACDIDPNCRKQYKANFGIEPAVDVRKIKSADVPDHDLLLGGFPCQPFSEMAYSAGYVEGLRDRRGTLFHEILRIAKAKRPKFMVLENVRGLITSNNGEGIRAVVEGIKWAGYNVRWKVLNALNYGLPQHRRRVIIVATADKECLDRFRWPETKSKYKPLAEILERNPDKQYFLSERNRYFKGGVDKVAKQQTVQPATPCIWHETNPPKRTIIITPYANALLTGDPNTGDLVNGERWLTPRERLRLQGFPESFKNKCTQGLLVEQIGNAIPVPMVKAVIREVLRTQNDP